MKVGDYVRTYDGIGKVVETRIFLKTDEFRLDSGVGNITQIPDNTKWNDNRNIIKTSPNIIDLIEVGDILTIKDIFGNLSKVEVDENFKLLTGRIISIVTREQFKEMQYKIGGSDV